MRSPAVSGARSYEELTLAAQTEEQHQRELRKRQQYQSNSKKTFGREQRQADKAPPSGKTAGKTDTQSTSK